MFLCTMSLLFADNFYSDGHCFDGPLNIREYPSLDSNKIGQLKTGEEFTYLSRTGLKEEIGDKRGFWFKIRTKEEIEGYVFSGYVELNDERTLSYVENRAPIESLYLYKKYTLSNTTIYNEIGNPNKSQIRSGDFYFLDSDNENAEFYFVANEDLEFGWIKVNELKVSEESYYSEVVHYNDINQIHNSYEQAIFRENKLNNRFNENIQRNGPVLKYKNIGFHNAIGKEKYYYSIVDIANDNQIWLQKHYPEGRFYILYDTNTQKEVSHAFSFPTYSDDKKVAVTFGAFYASDFWLKIYEEDGDYYNLVYEEKLWNENGYGYQFQYIDNVINIKNADEMITYRFDNNKWLKVVDTR